jgi:Ca2+-binding EF-hand superfamily protein
MILGTLIGMQVQSSSDAAQSTSSESPTTGPVQQLFSTIDTSGDGKISQSELENYIEKLGGTQAEADSLYSALAQPGSNGITESQLASDAPTGPPPGGFAGPGSLLSASGASSSLIAMLSNLVQTLNTNAGASFGQLSSSSSLISQADNLMQSINAAGSGNITETDLEEFFTANGGTASQADKDFAALDTSGSTSLNSADFANALENLESNAGSGLPALTLLNALAQNATNGASRSSSA